MPPIPSHAMLIVELPARWAR